MKKAFILLSIVLLLAACGSKPKSRTPMQIGETILRALASQDFERMEETMTDATTYQAYREALTAHFKHDINAGFESNSYEGRMAETRTAFDRIRNSDATRFGFSWDDAVLVAVQLSDDSNEIEGFTDYLGMDVVIRVNNTDYRISTYGAVRTAEGMLLLKPGRFWLVKQ